MATIHRMDCTASAAGLLWECADGCGRRVVIDGRTDELTVIDHGDRTAFHSGSSGGVTAGAVTVDEESF